MYGRSTSNWTPAAVGLTERIGSLLKISAASASVLGDLKESHISVWLCGEGGRKGGRKEARTNEQVGATNDDHSWSLELARGREGRTREGGRNGLKNDTQLPLMFRLLSASQATPSDFFKTADGRTDADGDGVEL